MPILHPIPSDDGISCGDPALDGQRGRITRILNQLIELVREDESEGKSGSFRTALLDLGQAAALYLSQVLRYLHWMGYPLTEDQLRAFKEFCTEITRAVDRASGSRRDETAGLVGRLRAWWLDHLRVQVPRFHRHQRVVVRIRQSAPRPRPWPGSE